MCGKSKLFNLGWAVLFSVIVLASGLFVACRNGSMPPKEPDVFKVYFNANGGEPVPETQQVQAGGKIELPEEMIRTKYSFNGWCRDVECTEPWDFENDTVEGDVFLFAAWQSSAGGSRGGSKGNNSGNVPPPPPTPGYSITWPSELRWYIKQQLSTVSLTGKVTGEPGTCVWDNPGVYLPATEGVYSYDATFTPDDTSLSPQTIIIKVRAIDLGTGELGNPFKVSDPETLGKVGTGSWSDPGLDWDLDSYYQLTDNIDMSSEASLPVIGSFSNRFKGTFDGGNKTITGLTIIGSDNTGLFAYIDGGGTVKDLTLDDITVSGGMLTGGIAGESEGTITGCQIIGGTVTGDEDAGGIVGLNHDALVENCFSSCEVIGIGLRNTGGIAGSNEGVLRKCYATGDVSGIDYVGGIVGKSVNVVEKCYATGDVDGNDNIGGVAGIVTDDHSLVQNCYATGAVSGNTFIGGVAGQISTNGATVKNCYAKGDVKGDNRVGGIVGGMIGSNTRLLNNVALNEHLTWTGVGTYVGRVAGNIVAPNIYNYARDGIENTGGSFANNTKDGASLSPSDEVDDSWWKNPATWDTTLGDSYIPATAWDFSAVWKMDGTDPPTLQ